MWPNFIMRQSRCGTTAITLTRIQTCNRWNFIRSSVSRFQLSVIKPSLFNLALPESGIQLWTDSVPHSNQAHDFGLKIGGVGRRVLVDVQPQVRNLVLEYHCPAWFGVHPAPTLVPSADLGKRTALKRIKLSRTNIRRRGRSLKSESVYWTW